MAKSTAVLPTLLEGFRLYCLAEGKQPTTILWYMGKLKIFLRYLQTEGLPLDAGELTITHLRAFLVHLKENVKADENNPMKPERERSLSPQTIQSYARTPKAFFSRLAREGFVTDSPARLLKIPKVPNVIPETLSDSQIRNLVSVIDRKKPKGFRDY